MTMAKLRKMLTHPGKNESGQGVLAMVLLLLMLGAIILTPLLVFMQTGVKAGQVYESKLQEFYAADAGVEDAIWKINNGTSGEAYFLGEEVNDRNVSVNVTQIKKGTYKINSTATSDSGGNTTIECYYGALDYSSLLDNAITSNGTICVKGDVNGSVVAADCTPQGEGCNGTNCTPMDELAEPIIWPNASDLSAWYSDNVNLSDPFLNDYIDIDGSDIPIEPLYRKDGTLDIYNSEQNKPATATLNGTVYVTNDPSPSSPYDIMIGVKKTGDFTLNLNNHTIFSEGGIQITDACNITGSGCIIAVGDIKFAPKGAVGSNTTFVLIMSINGTVELFPGGDFYGAIVGQLKVDQSPPTEKSTIIWTGYGEGIDFPIGQGVKKVFSYTIK